MGRKQGVMRIALIGNPNSGKTTLFNTLTGLKQRVGNFPGVTVEKKIGKMRFMNAEDQMERAEIIDLPGTYSLFPKSEDERLTFNTLCDPTDANHPDLNIIVLDSTNLQRGLYLATQVIELGIPTMVALNMEDIARDYGFNFDIGLLESRLGCRVLMINARKQQSGDMIRLALKEGIQRGKTEFLVYEENTQKALEEVERLVHTTTHYAAFQVLTNYKQIRYIQERPKLIAALEDIRQRYEFHSFRRQALESEERFAAIDKILEGVTSKVRTRKEERTRLIDNIVTHPIWGYAIFLAIMFVMFQSVFSWAEKPMEFIEWSFEGAIGFLQAQLPEHWLTDLLTNGIMAGLSGIVVFVPQIAFLFLFIGLLEETGYMARVSFILDRFLRRFGLNGRSVIPLIGGFACAIPAIMATRSISSKKERLITILITPLMSCSARLPVYTLLIALVIPEDLSWGPVHARGITLFILYFLGITAALILSWILSRGIKDTEKGYFIMEMPDFKRPDWKNLGLSIFEKVKVFLFDAGKIIIAISMVLWFLSSYGPSERMEAIDDRFAQLDLSNERVVADYNAEKLEASFAGIFGKELEPLISPLGYDWKIGIAILTSFAAREVFVGTLATIYSVSDPENSGSIRNRMSAELVPGTSSKRYDLAFGLSLMIFYVFALQCMSSLAIVRRESGSWKWPIIQFSVMGIMAYVSAFIVRELVHFMLN